MRGVSGDLNRRIAARVRELRAAQALSLDALARKSGVSRSMISLVERGQSSPTAVVLEKLTAGLGVTLASLFESPEGVRTGRPEPVARRREQVEWQDPGSGYVRRNVSPEDVRQPMQIVEVYFPAGARVAFEAGVRDVRIYQQIWLIEGTMEITAGQTRHWLETGDCLAVQLDAPMSFYNPGRKQARYAVVMATETASRTNSNR